MKRVQPEATADDTVRESFLLLGEELKIPLVSILHEAELGRASSQVDAHARQALRTIESLLLYQRVCSGQLALNFEPVHVGSTMQEVASKMKPLMHHNNCRLRLDVQHGLHPVNADRRFLEAALLSLWQGFVTTIDEGSEIVCQARRAKNGVRLSLLSQSTTLETVHFSHINVSSAQPLAHAEGTSLDLMTAQQLFGVLGGSLGRSHSRDGYGIGATLPLSHQLHML